MMGEIFWLCVCFLLFLVCPGGKDSVSLSKVCFPPAFEDWPEVVVIATAHTHGVGLSILGTVHLSWTDCSRIFPRSTTVPDGMKSTRKVQGATPVSLRDTTATSRVIIVLESRLVLKLSSAGTITRMSLELGWSTLRKSQGT